MTAGIPAREAAMQRSGPALAPPPPGGVTRFQPKRYVGAAAGYLGPSELSVHFGLGAAPVIDELQVHWTDGSTSTYHQVPTNRTLTITAR